jgi:hypothetical protein
MATVGAFIAEKLFNMAAWIEREGVEGSHGIVVESMKLTPLSATLIASAIKAEHIAVAARDWDSLFNQFKLDAGKYTMFKGFVSLFESVRDRPDMHERFWRYMDMMCEVA